MATKKQSFLGDTVITNLELGGGIQDNTIDITSGTVNGVTNSGINPYRGKMLINCMSEAYKDANGQKSTLVIPRTGLGQVVSTQNAGSMGRGIFYWEGMNCILWAVGTNLYKTDATTTTLLINTLSTSASAKIGFIDYFNLSYQPALLVSDGASLWAINNVFTVFAIAFPTASHSATPVFLDGYLFVASSTGQIYNSKINLADFTTTPSYIQADSYVDNTIALARHKQYILAFGSKSIEFFIDAGFPSPSSPLSRQQNYTINVGLLALESLVVYDDKVYFLGKASDGSIGFYCIENTKLKRISTPAIERTFGDYIEPSSLGIGVKQRNGPYLFAYKSQGHSLVGINLYATSAQLSLIYDIGEDEWYVWTARNIGTPTTKSFNVGESGSGNSMFINTLPFNYTALTPYQVYSVDANSTGNLYRNTLTNYQGYDYFNSNCLIDYCVRTDWTDFGSGTQKKINKVYVTGFLDTNKTTQIKLYTFINYSKTNYNYIGDATVATGQDDPFLTSIGTCRRIQFELQWSGDQLASIDDLEIQFNWGSG